MRLGLDLSLGLRSDWGLGSEMRSRGLVFPGWVWRLGQVRT